VPSFRVRISGDDFGFSAAHFLALGEDAHEPLHGHNYRVAVEVAGPRDENQYVIDFAVLAELLKTLLGELDHCVLLPAEHASVCVADDTEEVVVTTAGRRWVLPRRDCRLLPMAATTAESLAEYLARRLRDGLQARTGKPPEGVQVEVEEYPGRSAICAL
jgi:6-pyruvoyltetrahydropterin/6-carboxytetrahydropterin synthase